MITLIICTYNREKYIFETLNKLADSCHAADGDYEIVVVNNKSTDGTEAECLKFAETHPDINFRYFVEQNVGLSYARNLGMAKANGKWLVFLDDDALVGINFFTNLSALLEVYPDAVAFGGKIKPYYEDGEKPEWMSRWTESWVSALNKGQRVSRFTNDYPIGALMGIRKDIAEMVGEFNVALGRSGTKLLGGEEKDYFERIKKISDKIYYFPSVMVDHCIPPHRLTREFISRLALGIGQSERQRTLNISRAAFYFRCVSEGIKWCATIILYILYLLSCSPKKGEILIFFRRHVSKGLFVG